MPNPDLNSHVTRRAVVGIATHHSRLLIIRRSEYVRSPRHFCFPGGGIEPGEDCSEALVREMQEELDLSVKPVRQVWQSQTGSGFELNWWLVELEQDFIVKPNAEEVEWWGWCTPGQFLKLEPMLQSNQYFMKAWAEKKFELQL